MSLYLNCVNELKGLASADRALGSQRFFKTGQGQYGEGDIFIGIKMPEIRKVAKKYNNISLVDLKKLVDSPFHEYRMTGLIICVQKFKECDETKSKEIYEFYFQSLKRGKINNWDLIDVTCDHIIGQYLLNRSRDPLYELVLSESLWERRASIMATFAFIKAGQSDETIKIAKILLHDKEDLIQKAVGWMLREVGKRVDEKTLTDFLDKNAHIMPRTMLRYSIERLDANSRYKYLEQGSI